MTPQYPWYHLIADDTLEQGDFFFNCPVLLPYWDGYKSDLPEGDGYLIKARKTSYNVVIMSQSCDLENDKLDLVLVCPHWSIDVFEQNNYPNAGKKHKISLRNKIRRGELPAYHMLAASDIPNHEHDIRLVSFRQVFSLPIDFVKHLATQQSPRLRLLPPYREHLGQAFARFFMRVGLPVSIPPFKK